MTNECVFCSVKSNSEKVIYESERCYVIPSKYPVSKGHLLVLPKEHYVDLSDTPGGVLGEMMLIAREFDRITESIFNAVGVGNIMNNGAAADQKIFHAHMHVIPLYNNENYYRVKNGEYWGNEISEEESLEYDKIKEMAKAIEL
ncbi:histidine triad (HIT) protein [mine drainage metagenome]|uniref:Histidine triad (HIT) protein n=1 Tax=mine drainage metagenome TaxID=410659 RepID=T0ZS88_9ZZZZ